MAKDKGWWEGIVDNDEAPHAADIKGAKYALMHSELSEGLEGVRKPGMSDKIPTFTIEEEELADVIIRIMDYAGFYKLRVSEAVIAKLQYNACRSHRHGGKRI